MSEMGTSIDSLRSQETTDKKEEELIRNIKEDYTEQMAVPEQIVYQPESIINEIQHERQQEVEEYLPPKQSLFSKIFVSVKDIVIFLIIFITFNYEPIVLVVDNWFERLNIPYIGLILRAIVASVVFFFIKKFI